MIKISPLTFEEYEKWLPLWKGYQVFYEAEIPDEVTTENWKRFHNPEEPMHALGAYMDGELVGFVHYIFHRTCWSSANSCYLQDLFASPEIRGKGIGRALIEAVYAAAKEKDSESVYWITQEGNITARKLYDNIADLSGFVHYEKAL
ncbi:MAG: GNAT family N-acetyltransferase [Kordiimonadaceae bacterium]|jgi:GNAT superfamily N-acetyltransferase|nr:GNAT family N-acetyltransferase [Kordiimonadaceae bacterium]MBT6033617.1 GNAT family N-acetyltransferase [Kordiimonadaceae bacterium]